MPKEDTFVGNKLFKKFFLVCLSPGITVIVHYSTEGILP
jgi:hypothetical protein